MEKRKKKDLEVWGASIRGVYVCMCVCVCLSACECECEKRHRNTPLCIKYSTSLWLDFSLWGCFSNTKEIHALLLAHIYTSTRANT